MLRNAIVNFHNNHSWAEENLNGLAETRHQEQFWVNAWTVIIGNNLIDPLFLPGRVDALTYRHFVEEELRLLLTSTRANTFITNGLCMMDL